MQILMIKTGAPETELSRRNWLNLTT
ncbi:hypothetical protein NC651_013832 [Populus alba x Populus x berolinensis]|nr:hypothetical protein NC651_013832 [Populus alba x Populus x berolinensis]